MNLEDRVTHAYMNDAAVSVASTPTTLFTAADGSIKVFDLINTTSEPEIVNTLEKVKDFDIRVLNDKAYGLVCGGSDCSYHNLSNFLGINNKHRHNDSIISEMKKIWRSEAKITQAIFTHGGQRACIGDLAANMVIIDISNPTDSTTFGKVTEKIKVNGEIVGLSYSYAVDLMAVTVADGGIYIYSMSSNNTERRASLGTLVVDKRVALTHEMGLVDDDDSDLSDLSDTNLDDEDSMFTETTMGVGGKNSRNKTNNLLKFASSKTAWNPVGDVLAVPNKNYKIDFYNVVNWAVPAFTLYAGGNHHKNYISGLAYSPDGKYLASISLDKSLIIWDIKDKKIKGKVGLPFIGCDITWCDNSSVAIGSNKGDVLTIDKSTFIDIITPKSVPEKEINDTTGTVDIANGKGVNNNVTGDSDDSGDDVNISDDEEEAEEERLDRRNSQDLDDFIIDDETNTDSRRRYRDNDSQSTELTDFNKRARRETGNDENHLYKLNVRSGWGRSLTKPYSVGSTPWEGSDRRYLTITPIGCVYTVKIQSVYKVTVLFFDEEKHRKYFFDDLNGFDICSINDQGSVFATSGYKKQKGFIARIEYKDHSNGKTGETQWIRDIALRPYEFITCVSVYGNNIFVCTNKGFVRRYNLYGRLQNIMMMDCVVGIMNNNNYVFTVIKRTIGSGYLFNIQDLDGEYIQQEVGLPLITENDFGEDQCDIPVKSMFFSSEGEPCLVRNDGILMVLTRWRDSNSKPVWKPLLDIQEGVSRAGRGTELKAWPLGLFGDNFMFVPFRGTKFPIFPLLTPMNVDVRIPLNYYDPNKRKPIREIDEEDRELFGDEENEIEEPQINKAEEAEEQFLRTLVLAEILNDAISNNEVESSEGLEKLQLLSLDYDKALLIQIDDACSSGDSDDAYELCKMLRDSRALNAAQRLAEMKSMAGLARRIMNLREARMAEEEHDVLEEE